MATEQEQEKYKVEGRKAGDFAPPDETQVLTLQKLVGRRYCLQLHQVEQLGGGPIENIVRGLYLTSLDLAGSLAVEIAIVCLTKEISPDGELTFFVEIFHTDDGIAYQRARGASNGLEVLHNSIKDTMASQWGKYPFFGLRTVLLLGPSDDSDIDEPQAAKPQAGNPQAPVQVERHRWRSFCAELKKIFTFRNVKRTLELAEDIAGAFS